MANFEKYLGTFLLFHLQRGGGGKIGIFEKSPYHPSKKYLLNINTKHVQYHY